MRARGERLKQVVTGSGRRDNVGGWRHTETDGHKWEDLESETSKCNLKTVQEGVNG